MDSKKLLGDIFISYSSKDKDFVRRLAGEIEAQGYSIWLDEKKLIAGDSLPRAIGKAIHKSKVSIIVLSRNSISSNWVQYEISQATSRMVKGQMRLIPVLIEDIELPPEIGDLVYVDFRESSKSGLRKVLNALDYEASKYDLRQIVIEPVFEERIEDILESIFDSKTQGALMGEYKSVDFKSVMLGQTEIWYEIVSSYGYKMPLNQQWWDEFSNAVADWGVPYVLVITERPIEFEPEEIEQHEGGIILLVEVPTYFVIPHSLNAKVIILDLSGLDNSDDFVNLLGNTKELITNLVIESESQT